MSLRRRIEPHLVAAFTSPRTRAARGRLAEWQRRLRREPRRVVYFHQADDPYAHLAVQVLDPLLKKYDVELAPHLVGPPPDAAAPERRRLVAHARRDAADVAPHYGLEFADRGHQPDPQLVRLATRILAGVGQPGRFASVALRVGRALWAEDVPALEAAARDHPPAHEPEAREALARGDALRSRLGHYLGGTFFHAGEWFWGVDRLHHLERRLAGLGALRPGADPRPIVARPTPSPEPLAQPHGRVTLEFFLSLRSPYSYVAMERVFDLPRRLPVDLVLRPVLPMVMRGLPVPREKRLYIVRDTRREAEDAGVPFGRVCDPVGRPVERAFSLYPWARERGRAADLLLAFARASFADGIDTGTDTGLRRVAERAGLSWQEALLHLDRDDGWRAELEANREELLCLGLWGVPCFRLRGPAGEPDFQAWGQDRLWRVELEIRRRLGG